MKIKTMAISVAAALMPALAMAASHDQAIKGAQDIFNRLGNGQAHITKTFDGPPESGLTGMMVNLGGAKNMIAYATPNGKYIIIGAVFGADGRNYSMEAAQKYLPPPPPPPNASKNYEDLKQTHSYTWGQKEAPKEVWAVLDPDCIFCHKFYQEIAPFVKKGDVKVQVVQVGFLKPDSLGKAAAIMSAQDPQTVLAQDEAKFNASTEEGGIKPDLSNAKAVGWVKSNNDWMQSHGIGGTPYLLYRDPKGNIAVTPGFPQDIKAFLDGVGPGKASAK